jgi:hypothetical protein
VLTIPSPSLLYLHLSIKKGILQTSGRKFPIAFSLKLNCLLVRKTCGACGMETNPDYLQHFPKNLLGMGKGKGFFTLNILGNMYRHLDNTYTTLIFWVVHLTFLFKTKEIHTGKYVKCNFR